MANIKLSNSVKLDISSVDGRQGINMSNTLLNDTYGADQKNWTATADGWLWGYIQNNSCKIFIDGVQYIDIGAYGQFQCIPVRKGQVIGYKGSDSRVTNNNIKVYGLK